MPAIGLSRPGRARSRAAALRAAFTLTELLVAIAIIVVLLGLLLPTLGGVWSSGEMTKSMNNMRQIALWMNEYANENADYVVPSRFNYDFGTTAYKGKVRSNPNPQLGDPNSGTWSDILQTVFQVGVYPEAGVALNNDYRFDSPDRALYDLVGIKAVKNPFRSAAFNQRATEGVPLNSEPRPFGNGASERGYPGYFAANDFFFAGWPTASDHGAFYTNAQIRFPSQSLYLVDSYAGEIIEDAPIPFDNTGSPPTIEVDFRYGGEGEGTALILFLDGHIDPQTAWQDLDDLEQNRRIRVRDLTSR